MLCVLHGPDPKHPNTVLCEKFHHLIRGAEALQHGKLIHPRQQSPALTSADSRPLPVPDHKHRLLLNLSRLFCLLFGKLRLPSMSMGKTKHVQRTFSAQRRSVGQTHTGSELHHGLIEVSRPFRRHTAHQFLLHGFLHLCIRNQTFVLPNSGNHPQYISVHCRSWHAKCNGGDGSRRIAADAGKLQKLLIFAGHFTSVVLLDLYRRLLQIPHSVIIAQTLPEF